MNIEPSAPMRLNLLNKTRPGLVIIGWSRLSFLLKNTVFYQSYSGIQSLLCSSYSVFFVVFSINVQLLIYFQLCLKSFFLTRPQNTSSGKSIKLGPSVEIVTEFLSTPADNEDLRRNRRPPWTRGLDRGHRQPELRPGERKYSGL